MTRFVAVDDIVALHANAHYAYIFTGSAKLFCPIAIGDVELPLDAARFVLHPKRPSMRHLGCAAKSIAV